MLQFVSLVSCFHRGTIRINLKIINTQNRKRQTYKYTNLCQIFYKPDLGLICVQVWYVRPGQFVWRASLHKRKVKQDEGVAVLESRIASWLTAEPV